MKFKLIYQLLGMACVANAGSNLVIFAEHKILGSLVIAILSAAFGAVLIIVRAEAEQ